jgi:hypothetical protein
MKEETNIQQGERGTERETKRETKNKMRRSKTCSAEGA